jgi:threonine dehydratase
MKKRFSKKFRRSVLRKKSRKMSLHKKNKKALRGGATASGDKLTIPSFRQTSPTGTGIINQLAGNHAQTLAYSAYDDQVSKPTVI